MSVLLRSQARQLMFWKAMPVPEPSEASAIPWDHM